MASTAMPTRYDTAIDDETLFIDRDDDRLEIGPLGEIIEIIGGDSYTLEYSDEQGTAPWLQTDDDSTVTFDVRSVLAEMDYTADVVDTLSSAPTDETTTNGHPFRTELFARLMMTIWQSKGNLPEDSVTDTIESIAVDLTADKQ
ncbi:hypothetical protein [Halocatena halophila]|uniref:hypothetical protein n=1 Tax=Halocatena halophila TaxID=2814576 RepID=UPI002ED5DEB7